MTAASSAADRVLAPLDSIRSALADCYRDLHEHPEVGYQETRTAGIVADRLRVLGYEVTTGVGTTGVTGVLRNGDGPVVLCRADMDALPVTEETGLPYASKTAGVMHACGHDTHVASLLTVADLFARAEAKAAWKGTLVLVFQPSEEDGSGARAMLADGLADKIPHPDVCLAQHVAPAPAGHIVYACPTAMSAADSLRITLYGQGAHGSRPEAAIDPVVMAAATVMRYQTIVARELPPSATAVVTVGALNAGTGPNIIPDTAELQLNIRTFDPAVRTQVLDAVHRIADDEAHASRAPKAPEYETLAAFPMLVNDAATAATVTAALADRLGADKVHTMEPATASEDFGEFGTAFKCPHFYWNFGGIDPAAFKKAVDAGTVNQDIPANHSPLFAPVVEPSLTTAVQAMVTAAMCYLEPVAAG
ncbi:amidohydrolase [Streptomyces sp. NPDC052225]|uniref:amidohydrolase n=1 Tax=Streptomyces sp. NPDC052225 TaxID=3154949 RepID=UPI0034271B36